MRESIAGVLSHSAEKVGFLQRLRNHFLRARTDHLLALTRGETGHGKNRRPRILCQHSPRSFDAVHVSHDDIHQNSVWTFQSERFDRLVPALRFDDVVPSQHLSEQLAYPLVIVHDQNLHLPRIMNGPGVIQRLPVTKSGAPSDRPRCRRTLIDNLKGGHP